MPNPDDRRSTFVEITPAGRVITDRLLPGIRVVERGAMDAPTKSERVQFLLMLGKVLGLSGMADEEPISVDGEWNRPAGLTAHWPEERPSAATVNLGRFALRIGTSPRLPNSTPDADFALTWCTNAEG